MINNIKDQCYENLAITVQIPTKIMNGVYERRNAEKLTNFPQKNIQTPMDIILSLR